MSKLAPSLSSASASTSTLVNSTAGSSTTTLPLAPQRPSTAKRQESAPSGLGSASSSEGREDLARDAAAAAEVVNGYSASSPSNVSGPRPPAALQAGGMPSASRPAPARPLLAGRPAPQPPGKGTGDVLPSSSELGARKPAHGPREEKRDPQQQQAQRQEPQPLRTQQQREEKRERGEREQGGRGDLPRPPGPLTPAKSMPATSHPATQPAPGAAGATVGPPPVKPLQPAKKIQIQADDRDKEKKAAAGGGGGVAAAAAALEKPKEKRISTMTEVQIMEKLRQVVSDDDPKLIYSKIKKVGQGSVFLLLFLFWL
jgi:hypothetical protein